MWTILRYRYISCFKSIFSPFFFCKYKLSRLVSAVLIAVAIVFGTNIAIIFMKVDSHFYGIGYTRPRIFCVFKAFSLLIFYMGFYILIWGFCWGISGVFKKFSVGALDENQTLNYCCASYQELRSKTQCHREVVVM